MSTVKRGWGRFKCLGAATVALVCSILHLSPPVWAQQVSGSREIQVLNQKLDILIDAMIQSGQVRLSESTTSELCQLNRSISANPQQAKICSPNDVQPQQPQIRGYTPNDAQPQQPQIRGSK